MEQSEVKNSDNAYIANKNSSLQKVGEFLREALAASDLKIRGQVMRFESGGDYMTFGRWIGFNSWEEFGKFREWGSLGKIYDAKHGEGSWIKYLEGWNAIHQDGGKTEIEYLEYLEYLSTN